MQTPLLIALIRYDLSHRGGDGGSEHWDDAGCRILGGDGCAAGCGFGDRVALGGFLEWCAVAVTLSAEHVHGAVIACYRPGLWPGRGVLSQRRPVYDVRF